MRSKPHLKTTTDLKPVAKVSPDSNSPSTPGACTNFQLRKLLRVVSRLYDTEMARAGLKGTQFSLLSTIAALGAVQPNDLARRMDMDASTLSRNLRLLVERGWAAQGPGPDARSRTIELTPAGRDKLVEARRYWKEAQRSLNQRLGLERVAALHRLIDDGLRLLGASPRDHAGHPKSDPTESEKI